MKFRIVALAATLLLAAATPATRAQPVDSPAGHAPTLLIYLAKGAPDACGRGCDRWIAIEGKVDKVAADRVEQFLRGVPDPRLPVYFHSPGGEGSQAFAIARMLRARKLTARVGRTIAEACPGTQADEACVMIKSTRPELRAAIVEQGAMCNSACGLMFFGATTREVGPDVGFGVHNSKIDIDFKRFVSERQRDQAMAEVRAKSDRQLREFIEAMGIGRELFDLIETVSYENRHMLTRDELYRFRIDPRSFGETPWVMETAGAPFIRKAAFARLGGRFIKLEWRLSCSAKNRSALLYARETGNAGAGLSAVAMTAGAQPLQRFIRLPMSPNSHEVWGTVIPVEAMTKLFEAASLAIGESTALPGGATSREFFDIDTIGLEAAWSKLQTACARRAAPGSRKATPPGSRTSPGAEALMPEPR
jgi:hypothetical protein